MASKQGVSMSRFGGLSSKLSDAKAAAEPVSIEPVELPTQEKGRRPAREGKKFLGGWYSKGLSREVAQLALDNDTTVQALVGEAIDLLFRQYGKHPHGER
jgi:hypothetical protein